jgi:hypothetical protein
MEMVIRDDVADFALAMEKVLEEHDDRPGWEHMTDRELFNMLGEELIELSIELKQGGLEPYASLTEFIKNNFTNIQHELVDVANFCMMLYSNIERTIHENEVPG